MKRYIYIISLALILIGYSSCQDYLNVQPSNVLVISSFNDVKSLMGSHLKMFTEGSNGRLYLKQTSVFFNTNSDYLITHFYSDDLLQDKYLDNPFGRNNRGDLYKSLDWMHPSIHEDLWRTYYGNIGFYNMVISELEKLKNVDATDANLVKAEAKFLRAWSFFRLMQFFSPYHEDKLGLPLNTDPEKVSTYDKSRKTQTENYAFIIGELEEILSYNTAPSPTYSIFFDRRIVHALLSQIYHYKGDSGAKAPGDYEKAITHAQKAMEGRLTLDVIRRVPDADASYGLDKSKSYSLLTFLYNDYDRYKNTIGIPGWSIFQYASDELYNLFPDEDKRKNLYFKKDKEIIKFESDFPYYYYQWDFFTAAEMQLIIAESYERMGKEVDALKALNEFTRFRYTTYTRSAGESVLESILNERRKEFCFDYCMRWLDLTRLQQGWKRKALDKKEGGTYTLKDGDFRFCMPIPKVSELQDNKIKQNPGWGNF